MTRVCQSMKIGGKEMVLCDKRAGYAGSGEAHRWSTVVTRDIWLARLSPSLTATFGYISILCAHPSSTNLIQYTTLRLHFASCSCLLLICQVVINTILTVGWVIEIFCLFLDGSICQIVRVHLKRRKWTKGFHKHKTYQRPSLQRQTVEASSHNSIYHT